MKRGIVLAVLLAVLLFGCAPSRPGDLSAFAPGEEARLVLYTCLSEGYYIPLVREFQEETGIWVEVCTGTEQELLEKLLREPGSCDLLLGCSLDHLLASGVELARWENLSWQIPVVIYNPMLIRQNPPTGLRDLMDPAWQGKIAFGDPAQGGFCGSMLHLIHTLCPEDGLARLAGNVTELSRDCWEAATLVSEGTFCLAVVPEEVALSGQGTDWSIVWPEEGLFPMPDTLAIPAQAARQRNAEAFAEFCLRQEAQDHAWQYHNRRSVLPELSALKNPECYDPAQAAGYFEMTAAWQALREVAP